MRVLLPPFFCNVMSQDYQQARQCARQHTRLCKGKLEQAEQSSGSYRSWFSSSEHSMQRGGEGTRPVWRCGCRPLSRGPSRCRPAASGRQALVPLPAARAWRGLDPGPLWLLPALGASPLLALAAGDAAAAAAAAAGASNEPGKTAAAAGAAEGPPAEGMVATAGAAAAGATPAEPADGAVGLVVAAAGVVPAQHVQQEGRCRAAPPAQQPGPGAVPGWGAASHDMAGPAPAAGAASGLAARGPAPAAAATVAAASTAQGAQERCAVGAGLPPHAAAAGQKPAAGAEAWLLALPGCCGRPQGRLPAGPPAKCSRQRREPTRAQAVTLYSRLILRASTASRTSAQQGKLAPSSCTTPPSILQLK